jgi:carbonic anhydrase
VDDIQGLLDHNREWAARIETEEPGFFSRLARQQQPEYLWIGCSDSRVPANQITGLMPGEVFVHRNVANVVLQTDLNCMSVIDYAIHILRVKHVIVCGHYGCGGVLKAMAGNSEGAVGHWLSGIRELYLDHQDELATLDQTAAERRLCELNVLHQARSLCRSSAMHDAWGRGQQLTVHAWIYGIEDGLLRSLGDPVTAPP